MIQIKKVYKCCPSGAAHSKVKTRGHRIWSRGRATCAGKSRRTSTAQNRAKLILCCHLILISTDNSGVRKSAQLLNMT